MNDTRKIFFDTMMKLAENDKDIIILLGDLGFSFYEEFEEKYPDQIINVGASEQNLVCLAMGLALAGKKPWCYSGAIFMVMRPYEQVRHLAFNNLNVKLIGTKASQFLGWTHNLTGTENEEDLLKNLPNIQRFYPESEEELLNVLVSSYKNNYPTYIRL